MDVKTATMGKVMSSYIRKAGGSALGARLRQLSERIDREATQIYADAGISFRQRWFGVLDLLAKQGPMTVGELAEKLSIRHVSVSQTRSSLEKAGLLISLPDDTDSRKRVLSLSPKAETLVQQMNPYWDSMAAAAQELGRESGDIVRALNALEEALDRKPLASRVAEKLRMAEH